KKVLTGGALVLAATASIHAQPQPFMLPGTAQPPLPKRPATKLLPAASSNAEDSFFNGKLPDAIAKGKFNINVRLRYEQADEEGVGAITKDSHAPTIRTRFGYTTAPLYGFQGMLEGVNVSVLGPEHNYNAAGSNGQGARPVVADPPLTRLDQAWLAYSYTNWISAKVGQQQINLDNQRFIGDVGWRQNMQTYDAVSASSEPNDHLNLYYAYLWDVHRVFGNVGGLPAANTDFDSRSHLINISYSGWKYGRFVGYTYLLDLHNAVAGDPNSCATYGGYFAGQAPISDKVSADYRAEFAWQTDYADNTLRYGTEYYNLEGGANIKPFAFGAGYEDLGSGANTGAGGGRASFRTPLATLHAFNGWDDVFLATPANGLRDLYGYYQVTLPAVQAPVRLVYHKYDADHGGADYGSEFDIVASKKFGKHWTALVKYAYYSGQDAAPPSLAAGGVDIQKFWAQVEFNF
ncbi:MAG: alginate export family protein, partial [Verrucomicrobia bacterium]|nr:alginate export family protein [Verrucomicrobiota bacterium]